MAGVRKLLSRGLRSLSTFGQMYSLPCPLRIWEIIPTKVAAAVLRRRKLVRSYLFLVSIFPALSLPGENNYFRITATRQKKYKSFRPVHLRRMFDIIFTRARRISVSNRTDQRNLDTHFNSTFLCLSKLFF